MRFQLLVPLIVAAIGCQRPAAPTSVRPSTSLAEPVPVEAAGLHNVFRVSDRLYSGSGPEGDAGFASLARLGVRTVLSVDGATPAVAAAGRHGLKYIHLPVTYDGIPRDRVLALSRVVRDLPGPIYVHCHHGKHRGPAAVAVMQMCLADGAWDASRAEGWLRTAGTDPRYLGLVGLPRSLRPPTASELSGKLIELPEVTAVGDLTRLMVAVDSRWDNLKLVKAAGWKSPADHPDIDPAHEAVQLGEHYREAMRLDSVRRHRSDFARCLDDAAAWAKELEGALRSRPVDLSVVASAFERSASACTRCHEQFRDRP